jgi:hypothetical protein
MAPTSNARLSPDGSKISCLAMHGEEYALAAHDLRPERIRTDLLARLGAFLAAHLSAR